MIRIAVIGAGVVGLSTAVNVQTMIPEAKITIIADKFGNDTTSSGAGGILGPFRLTVPGVSAETTRGWIKASWDYYTSLAMSPLAKETGQTLVPGFALTNKPPLEKQLHEDIVFDNKELTPEDLKRMKFPFKYGSSFSTIITQTKKYMPWLLRKFKEQGGTVEFRTVGTLKELTGTYDIVMNCAALGCQQLLPDPTMVPIKGQLVKVRAPWVKMFIYCDTEKPTYLIPHNDYIIVGGSKEEGTYSTDVSPEVEKVILQRAGDVLPAIKAGEVVGNWAGLRPSRVPLRLEKELLTVNGKKLRVVHNYGHGANGVALSWGTSLQAARLAREWADEIPRSSRL